MQKYNRDGKDATQEKVSKNISESSKQNQP